VRQPCEVEKHGWEMGVSGGDGGQRAPVGNSTSCVCRSACCVLCAVCCVLCAVCCVCVCVCVCVLCVLCARAFACVCVHVCLRECVRECVSMRVPVHLRGDRVPHLAANKFDERWLWRTDELCDLAVDPSVVVVRTQERNRNQGKWVLALALRATHYSPPPLRPPA
jgi:hypothetical protein